MFPSKIFLLRGNYEFENINMKYGFNKEILNKYFKEDPRNMKRTRDLYINIHETFRNLPIAATVDDSLFCVHAGISKNTRND